MITTKIKVDTSEIKSSFNEIDNEIKKIEQPINLDIDTKGVKDELQKVEADAKGMFAKLKDSLDIGSIFNFAIGDLVADGIGKVTEGIGFLAEQASKADGIGTQLENGFRLAGLSGEELSKQLAETTQFARDLGFELGVAPERLKELSATAGALGGATGKMNKDLSKLAVGVEMATNGAIKGEQAIKIFSRGIADPENAEAIDKLKKSFPQLGEALLSANDPAGKLQAGLNALSGTFETMKNDTSDVEARFGIFKMQIAEGAQAIGGAFLGAFNTDRLLQFGAELGKGVDIFGALETAGTQLGEAMTTVLNTIIDVIETINNSPLFNTLKNNFELVGVALLTYLGYTKAIAYEQTILETKTKAIAIAQGAYNAVITLGTTIQTAYATIMTAVSNGTVIATAKTYLMNTAQTLLNAVMSANPIGLVVVALGALTAGLVYAYKNSETFRKIIDGIWETMKGWLKSLGMIVTKVLEFFGILGKDVKVKATKEIEKDTKAIETNITNTNLELDKQSTKVEKNVKAVKTLQQQYNELYEETVKLADANNFGKQYDKNIIKLQELKAKLNEVKDATKQVDFDILGTAKFEITEVKNKSDIQIRPEKLTLKPFEPIKIEGEVEDETTKQFAKSLTDGFSKIDYTSIFKKKETAFDESLNEDRANLLTSLQQNEISYEEYSERLNEIDRNRRETQKEGNSEFINGLNQTLALSFMNSNKLIEDSMNKTFDSNAEKLLNSEITTEQYTKSMADNIGLAMASIGMATAEMALQGGNLLKELALNTIKTARAMFNAYLAPLLLKELTATIFAPLAFAKLAGYQILGNSLLSIAEGFAMQLKDGAININGAGTSRSDSIPAMLSKGESVINARSTAQNEPYLEFINNGGRISDLIASRNNVNTKMLEMLMAQNNNILMHKNLSVNNRIEVANAGISVKFKR